MNYKVIIMVALALAGLTCLSACSTNNTNTTATTAASEEKPAITDTTDSIKPVDSSSENEIFKKGDSLAPFNRQQLAYATVYISDCETSMPTQKIINSEILDSLYEAANNSIVGDLVDDMMSTDGGDVYTFYDENDAILSKFSYAGGGMIYQNNHRYNVENIIEIRRINGILDYNDILEFDYEGTDNYKDGYIIIE